MGRSRSACLVSLCVLASACSPRVGHDCDETAARTIVYDVGGSPAYAGQSILITSCASGGSFCHTDTAMHRYGAPFGMNFDPMLADRGLDEAAGARHLYEAQVASHHFRDSIFGQVSSGAMPPRGIGDTVALPAYRTYTGPADAVGTPVPSIRSAEGREILRNWLACGSPVVESTTLPIATPCASDAQCTTTHRCDTARGFCEDVGAIVDLRATTTMPTWGSIYATVLSPTCALSVCHGTLGAAASGNLDLSSPALAYTALVGTASSVAACGTRVVAGDPGTSFLVQKVEGTQDPGMCGDPMPIGGTLSPGQIAAIRDWITAGALMN